MYEDVVRSIYMYAYMHEYALYDHVLTFIYTSTRYSLHFYAFTLQLKLPLTPTNPTFCGR